MEDPLPAPPRAGARYGPKKKDPEYEARIKDIRAWLRGRGGTWGNHQLEIICAERYGWTQAETLASGRNFIEELMAYWDAKARNDKADEQARKRKRRNRKSGMPEGEDVSLDELMATAETADD